jgi:hypothetical protein
MKTSTQSKHTLGPLHTEENANSIALLAANSETVADIINDDDCCVTDAMRQYASLFAAAPDMLAALKAMQKAFQQVIPGIAHIACQDYAIVNDAPILATKAIAKAEGRQ